MGMPIVDNCDLEPLPAAASAHNQWDFQLTVAPLRIMRITGDTGSPVNPHRRL
jgi:hypothetical protein